MAQTRVLAERVIPGEGLAREAARIVAANLLMIVCAQIAVPVAWSPVPMTGQTFGVMMVAVLLGARRGALTLTLYLVEGALGLPVFQPFGAPGVLRLAGPTAGYLWAYPAAAFVTGWLVERTGRASALRLAAALVPGQALIFAGGWAWLAVASGFGARAAFFAGVAPFLAGDVIKIALAVLATRTLERVKAD